MFVYRDEEFGEIYIRSDSRACRLIFRVKDNGLQITCPEGYAVNRVKSAVDDNREKLRALVSRSATIRKNRVLSTGDSIPCYGGDICLLPGVSNKFLFRYEGDCLQVFCPPGIDLNRSTNVRKTLSRGVGRFVYRRAQECSTSEAESNLVEIGVASGFGDDRSRAAKVGALYPSGRDTVVVLFDVPTRRVDRLCYLP